MHYIFPDDSTGCISKLADGRLPIKLLKKFVADVVILGTKDTIRAKEIVFAHLLPYYLTATLFRYTHHPRSMIFLIYFTAIW